MQSNQNQYPYNGRDLGQAKRQHKLDSYQKVDELIPDTPFTSLNFNSTLRPQELNKLRDNLMQNIGFLNANRNKIRFSEFSTLANYHQYALNTLNNMLKIKEVEAKNPFTGNLQECGERNPVEDLVYNDRGLLEQRDKREFIEEWEHQFNTNLVNPPCYSLPPSNCFKPRTSGC